MSRRTPVISTRRLRLILDSPFVLAHGASAMRENVLLQIQQGRQLGLGEAAVVPYYGTSPDAIVSYLESHPTTRVIDDALAAPDDPLPPLPPGPAPARAALDMALHDLWGQRRGLPLHVLWGLDPRQCPRSSFTVAMDDDDERYRQRLLAARDFPLIKLKLGSGDLERDLQLVRLAQDTLRVELCLDANGGWSVDEAATIIPRLLPHGPLFIEQPVPAGDPRAWHALRRILPYHTPPLIADESMQQLDDIDALAGGADGVNIKLAKCGGLNPARAMITRARQRGMKVLLGCMIESSVAVTAAAHLAPLCDFADLDGHLLLADDPFRGLRLEQGKITLPRGPGLGVQPCPG